MRYDNVQRVEIELHYEEGLVLLRKVFKDGRISDSEVFKYVDEKEDIDKKVFSYGKLINENDLVALAYFGGDMAEIKLKRDLSDALKELTPDTIQTLMCGAFSNAGYFMDMAGRWVKKEEG